MTIQEVLKHTKQMPMLLQRALSSLPEAERANFLSAFKREVEAKEATHKKLVAMGYQDKLQRPNNQREVDSMMKGINKLDM